MQEDEMVTNKIKSFMQSPWAAIMGIMAFAYAFGYFYFRINPLLIYQEQQPVFFFDSLFIQDFSHSPGGLLDWFSRLLSQLYYVRWTGALLLALLITILSWLFQRLLKQSHQHLAFSSLPFLPAALFIHLYSAYHLPLSLLLGVMASLLFALIFFRFKFLNLLPKLLLFIVLFAALYYLVGGLAFLFAALAIVQELVNKTGIIASAVYVLFSAAIPWMSTHGLFLMRAQDAFLNHLKIKVVATTMNWIWVLLTITLLFLMNKLYAQYAAKRATANRNKTSLAFWTPLLNVFILLVCFVVILVQKSNPVEKQVLELDYYVDHFQWPQVIDSVNQGLQNTYIGQFQANRALSHTHRLLDDLFTFQQRSGVDGLFLHETLRSVYARQYSDIFFDLGLINEAQHWAHEALSVDGDTPKNLQRLAQVYLLKGEKEAAGKCLQLLKRTCWHKKWAREFEKNLTATPADWPEELKSLHSRMLTNDFIITPTEPELCLEALLDSHPTNKTAFEYLMAYYLITGKVGRAIRYIKQIDIYQYAVLPRHIEEAILLYLSNTENPDPQITKLKCSLTTIQKFKQMVDILNQNNGDRNKALPQLRKFSDTYWFYAMYYFKKQ